jgi:hypothetical protein
MSDPEKEKTCDREEAETADHKPGKAPSDATKVPDEVPPQRNVAGGGGQLD